MPFAPAAALAVAAAVLGGSLRWLTVKATPAAALIGAIVLYGADWLGGLMLGVFFVSGSALTFLTPGRSERTDPQPTGRTIPQVFANGAWAATGALLISPYDALGWVVLGGALAAAQADTWATEIGVRLGRAPRLITSGRLARPGTSGAITLYGTLGGIAGAALMAAVMWPSQLNSVAILVLLGGVTGMVVDSVIGATLQAHFRCDACGAEGESPGVHCGRALAHSRGFAVVNNDTVNFFATGCGGLTAGAGVLLT